jgi:hypothetical protein
METQQDMERKALEFEDRIDLDKMKLESAEDQAAERIRIAEEKMDMNERIQRERSNAAKRQR